MSNLDYSNCDKKFKRKAKKGASIWPSKIKDWRDDIARANFKREAYYLKYMRENGLMEDKD